MIVFVLYLHVCATNDYGSSPMGGLPSTVTSCIEQGADPKIFRSRSACDLAGASAIKQPAWGDFYVGVTHKVTAYRCAERYVLG